MTPLCAFCLHTNPSDAKFCNECGNTLRLRPCSRCDAVNDVDARQCHFCGATLLGSDRHADSATAASGNETETFPDSLQRRADAVIERASSASSPAMAAREAPAAGASASGASFASTRKGPPAAGGVGASGPDSEPPATGRQPSSVIRALEMGAFAPGSPLPVPVVAAQAVRSNRRTVAALSILIVALAVSAEGYRRTSGLDAWTDVPALRSLWAFVQSHAPSAAMNPAVPAQPITTVAPNEVMRDALSPGAAVAADKSVVHAVPIAAPASASAPSTAVSVAATAPASASSAAPAANATAATSAAGATTPAANASSAAPAANAGGSTTGGAADRAAREPPAAAIGPAQPSQRPAMSPPTQTASRSGVARRTGGRNAGPATADRAPAEVDAATPAFELPVVQAVPVAPCMASVAALGLCAAGSRTR
jgi:ribosomal protein L40E